MAACMNVCVSCISLYMCSLYSIYICIQLYRAKGINVALDKKIKFVCLMVDKHIQFNFTFNSLRGGIKIFTIKKLKMI